MDINLTRISVASLSRSARSCGLHDGTLAGKYTAINVNEILISVVHFSG